jgi:hypothetical protein
MTSLAELLGRIDDLDRDEIVYAATPWTHDSDAVCADEDEDGAPAGLTYLLEVELVHDVTQVWSARRGGRTPTAEELTDAVIHYATHDAYLEPEGPS